MHLQSKTIVTPFTRKGNNKSNERIAAALQKETGIPLPLSAVSVSNGQSDLVRIRFHRDGSYSMHFDCSFLSLPRDRKREIMKEAVAERFRKGWPKYWSATAVAEGRFH
jgi:hypothetical protein